MFKLVADPTFTHTVRVHVPINGGYRDETLKATYRVVDPEELEKFDLRTIEGSTGFLERVIVSLDDIADEQGKPMPWSDELREPLFRLPYLRTALAKEYFVAVSGATVGN